MVELERFCHNEGTGGSTGTPHSQSSIRWGELSVNSQQGGRELGSDYGAPSISLTGEAPVAVHIRAYSATGEVTTQTVPRGTRLLFICVAEGLPEGNVSITYTWYQECTGVCEIQEGEPYYTAANDALLVDATSWDGRKRHTCKVQYHIEDRMPATLQTFLTLTLTG